MAAKKEVEVKTIQSCDDAINAIDKEIETLNKSKVALIAERFALIKEVEEIPLHQLNCVAMYGEKSAKEMLGDKWVG